MTEFDWHSAYRDVSWAYVRAQQRLDRLGTYIRLNFPHIQVQDGNPIDGAIVLLCGLVDHERELNCGKCGGQLVWKRTPLLPEPAGKWFHLEDTQDDHEVVVPWEGSHGGEHDLSRDRQGPGRISDPGGCTAGAVVQAAASQALP